MCIRDRRRVHGAEYMGSTRATAAPPSRATVTNAHLCADGPTYRKDCTPNVRPDILPLRFALQLHQPCFCSATRAGTVSYTHLRAHETRHDLVCRLLLEKKKNQAQQQND
eukprot:TRINITY_DN32472_c0_g1_i1.p3 TRINITY_DN32472_c0_g1~~TRINITY_DN32472_c0_g1_i1.p3  ORF type:complete len:110 (+),score=8.54 TRINITY_DN32472_c0_g1_i1:188-517(+)